MSATTLKRTLAVSPSSGKRSRQQIISRLCDLPNKGDEVFHNIHLAARAKERGYLRNRDARAKYEELERKLLSLLKEGGELDFPSEDWVFDVLPELNDLEADTLDALLSQAQQHAKYERAARELVMIERAKLIDEHADELRAVRAEAEQNAARSSLRSELTIRQNDEQAREEHEALRTEAQEKINALEDKIEELEATVSGQKVEMERMEAAAEAECERLQQEGETAIAKLRAAQEETDLKRETSRKLKEEIIDNDRLTVANLNRIKHLEALVEQHKAALDEAEAENGELRSELARTVPDAREAEDEAITLRELLKEREGQLLAMSRRLSDALDSRADAENMSMIGREDRMLDARMYDKEPVREARRRDSFLERFALSAHNLGGGHGA